jgi:hypothetical protein
MEGMVRREYFVQLTQAKVTQTALHATATEIGM